MIHYTQWLLLLALVAGIFTSCDDDDASEVFSDTPDITLVSMLPDTVIALGAPVEFRIRYQDGDGDLGEPNPEVNNLFIHDSRLNLTHGYRIQQLAPEEGIAIQGEVVATLTNIPLADPARASEQVRFEIWATDRAGNESNRITTPPLTVLAE